MLWLTTLLRLEIDAAHFLELYRAMTQSQRISYRMNFSAWLCIWLVTLCILVLSNNPEVHVISKGKFPPRWKVRMKNTPDLPSITQSNLLMPNSHSDLILSRQFPLTLIPLSGWSLFLPKKMAYTKARDCTGITTRKGYICRKMVNVHCWITQPPKQQCCNCACPVPF